MKRYVTHGKVEVAAADGTLALRATAYNVEAESGIVVMPGAFRDSLNTFLRDGYILWQHDSTQLPIGYPVSYNDSDEALVVTMQWHSHDFAQGIRTIVEERIAAGKGVDVSIGYYVDDEDVDVVDGRIVIARGELVECSIVLWGDNPEAEVVQTASDEITRALDAVKVAMLYSHSIARRVKSINALRRAEHRTMSKETKQRMIDLSQSVARLSEALAHVRQELSSIACDDDKVAQARLQLKQLLQTIQGEQHDEA